MHVRKMMSRTFKGASVFLSRSLVPPEIFDSLHGALKQNGAEVFLCSDPSRNGPNDYHVISSKDHEKFDELQEKGCQLLGPQCVLTCAKEHRLLPKQGFTCCLAMDGVKVLVSGFEMDEKFEIGKMVTAMGGALHTKASLDVNFVIVKNVLAAKYKWASNVLKKPIVTLSWLHQCWIEHRAVPQESYRVLPFSGLTICVTKIPAGERKEMEKLVVQNGGKYSPELTKKCTHLICDVIVSATLLLCDELEISLSVGRTICVLTGFCAPQINRAPEGDKYKVAKRWGNILIVTRKWLDQSVARRACLNEESYPVQRHSASSISGLTTCLSAQQRQDKGVDNLQHVPSSLAAGSNLESVSCAGIAGQDLEAPLSQNISTTCLDAPISVQKETQDSGASAKPARTSASFDGCVADDSQGEDNDMYLSDCRILIVGFDASEMRKLVNMVRRGGGSRYMSLNEKLTHIIVGTPSEIEKKEIRGLAALGVIYVVHTTWLEDCDFEKKEVPVLRRHIAYDLLLPKDPVYSNKGVATGVTGTKQWKASTVQSILPDDQLQGATNLGAWISSEKSNKLEVNINGNSSLRAPGSSDAQIQVSALIGKDEDWQKAQIRSCNDIQNVKSSSVFKGRLFRFSSSFPRDRRAEIIQWVNQGVGEVVDDQTEQDVHFTIECHGVTASPIDASRTTSVSTHWIRSCLEEGCLLEVGSHILYSPLPCQIPLPGFERFRFCVSQYDEKDRLLLRNLCFVLGAKLVEKLTKKVTHLLCKFTTGPKYEAACKWRIQSVTCDWIYECVKQNEIVAPGPFSPREVTSQDQEAGLCTTSQYSQPTSMTFGDNVSQFLSLSLDQRNLQSPATGRNDSSREETKLSSKLYKRARTLKDETNKGQLSLVLNQNDPIRKMTSAGDNIMQNTGEVIHAMPDVAAAIEDLVEQTSKINDLKSPWSVECDRSLFPSDCSIVGQDHPDAHSAFGLSKHWINRADRKDDLRNPSRDVTMGMYDGFSETQTESQVVGYEEDLSGRQMIIDRVRTLSSTPDTRG